MAVISVMDFNSTGSSGKKKTVDRHQTANTGQREQNENFIKEKNWKQRSLGVCFIFLHRGLLWTECSYCSLPPCPHRYSCNLVLLPSKRCLMTKNLIVLLHIAKIGSSWKKWTMRVTPQKGLVIKPYSECSIFQRGGSVAQN